MGGQVYDTTLSLPPYLYPNGSDVFSRNRRLLFSGSVSITTVATPALLRLIFFLYAHLRRMVPCSF